MDAVAAVKQTKSPITSEDKTPALPQARARPELNQSRQHVQAAAPTQKQAQGTSDMLQNASICEHLRNTIFSMELQEKHLTSCWD